MTKRREFWDWPPTMRPRRRPQPLQGEVLTPEPQRRVRVEVVHHYQPRQHSAPQPWLIALLAVAVLMWWAPLGTIILIAIVSIEIMEHPAIAIAIGAIIAMLVIVSIREHRAGRPW